MSQFFRFISLCDPCSRHYHAIVEFKDLKPRAKLITTLLTGLVGIVSLPVFGLLGVLTFRCLVRSFLLSKVKQIDPSQENSRIRNIEDQGIKNLSAQDVQSEKSTVFLEEKIVQTPILQTSEFENEAIEQKVDVGVQSTTLIQPEIEKESKEIILDKNDLQKDEPQEEFSLRMSEFSDAADFSENILILTGLELQRIQRKQESHEETMEQQKSLDCLIEKQSKNSIHDFQTDEIEEVLEGKIKRRNPAD
ncbi:MAG: hypothetical protein HWD61_00600 [Parachlamydiaceae bacterium]|nr:MAG: hypothetical protein HWD61_00600 [Parachlamydiaceae bacterium]